ncbi:LysE family translocator [Marinomonas sp. C2222]|uniref:LysE family translocator n=1 Tax=Marinomonas sargassi TaxID=2984494 RepID=A0ABT2YUZ1_9GAMM|nr:LysE family translocator [Marinomonas sargassi]MCV2403580.1 LysE family translocator [Marinomonas sargassi]
MQDIQYGLILMGAFIAMASPGPATLAIASTSMNRGRKQGLALASGILTGSLFWSLSAAFGLGALLYANVWLFEAIGYVGAVYLLFLAYKSGREALKKTADHQGDSQQDRAQQRASMEPLIRSSYLKGLAIHLTNPKAILFLGSLFALGLPSDVTTQGLLSVVAVLFIQSACVNLGYAILFSNDTLRQGYFKMRRTFEAFFTVFFAFAGMKILLSKLTS